MKNWIFYCQRSNGNLNLKFAVPKYWYKYNSCDYVLLEILFDFEVFFPFCLSINNLYCIDVTVPK